ncbi:high mobility group box domain-containing protein, partial [Dimargaris cristalligena]
NTYKRFRNAFIFFVNEQRKVRNPGQASIKNREFVQMMSNEWKALSNDAKKPYQDMAKADRERYDRDVEIH